jgi:diacylglycerol kinase (ATP)
MHITLVHKPDAGSGKHSKKALKKLLKEAGHKVAYFSTTDDDWQGALVEARDLVLIAGGDGTVGSVTRRLLGREVPFAMLPLGTANNIATKLGWTGSLEDVVARLEHAERRPFDLGVASGPWGTRRFLEGIGVGPFTRAMAFLEAEWDDLVHEPKKPKKELARDARLLRAFLHESAAQRYGLMLNGDPVEGPLLLLEVTNTGLIGPNLRIAPDADTGDGFFDVVLLSEADRPAFASYLDRYLAGDETPPRLDWRKAQQVRLTLAATRVHLDDELWPPVDGPTPPLEAPFEVDVRMERGALTALVPRLP